MIVFVVILLWVGARPRCRRSSSAWRWPSSSTRSSPGWRAAGVPRWGGVLISYAAVVLVVWGNRSRTRCRRSAGRRASSSTSCRELGAAVGDFEQALRDWYEGLPLPADMRATIEAQLAASGRAIGDLVARSDRADAQCARPRSDVPGRASSSCRSGCSTSSRTARGFRGRRLRPAADLAAGRREPAVPPRPRRRPLGPRSAPAGRVGLRRDGHRPDAAHLFGFGEFGQFTLVLALIAGVLEWFPIIGPIVAAIPAILIGLSISLPAALAAAVALYRHPAAREPHPGAEGARRRDRAPPGGDDPVAGRRRRAVRDRRRHPGGPGRGCRARPVPIRLPPLRRAAARARRSSSRSTGRAPLRRPRRRLHRASRRRPRRSWPPPTRR